MGNHPFNVIVILFWLVMMGWLVVAKILPPLRVGEPPDYGAILDSSDDESPTIWVIRMSDRTVGWAANKVERRADGVNELHSRVYLGGLPLDQFAPGWLAGVLKPVFADLDDIEIDKQSCFSIDPLGRLMEFDSSVRLADVAQAVKVHGQVLGTTLELTVQSGEIATTLSRSLSGSGLLGDELSPQSRLPGLRVGQAWTVPLYNPFSAATSPLEILHAAVEREDVIHWDDRLVSTRMVAYRDDPGSGLGTGQPRGRMWVRDDGVVLRQEVAVFRSLIQFERLPARHAAAFDGAFDRGGKADVTTARHLLRILRGDSAEVDQPASVPGAAF